MARPMLVPFLVRLDRRPQVDSSPLTRPLTPGNDERCWRLGSDYVRPSSDAYARNVHIWQVTRLPAVPAYCVCIPAELTSFTNLV